MAKKGGKRRLGAAHPAMKKWTIKKGKPVKIKK